MGQESNPDEPDLRMASRATRLSLDTDGQRKRAAITGEPDTAPDTPPQEQGDEGDLSEQDGATAADDAKGRGKVYYMRRILARVDQVRLAVRSLAGVVLEAEQAGYDRDVIYEVIHRTATAEDWPVEHRRITAAANLLAACGSPIELELLRLDERPVSSLEARKEAAESDGYYAEVQGRAIDACPYSPDQKALRAAWRRGWNKSRQGIEL